MNTLPRPKPLVVAILDGWGVNPSRNGNAIATAGTPTFDYFARHFPATAITASGLGVGLPPGVGGNSETGHRNIGAGRIEYQMLAHIDRAIEDDSFFDNDALLGAFQHAKKNGSNVHLMGLISRGGVHAHLDHLLALLTMAKRQKFNQPVFLHLFTDGRDSPPQSALTYLDTILEATERLGIGQVASIVGRFFAMDRNQNWERTQAAYDLLVGDAHERSSASARRAIERSYTEGVADEEIVPTAITHGGSSIAPLAPDDAVIFFNFRPDRARQLAQAFVTPEAVPFPTKNLWNVYFATLVRYDSSLDAPAAFFERKAEYPLSRVLASAGLRQLHIAETEKYAHVTYYLNVGHEEPFAKEEWVLVRSASVKDFAQKPEMEAGAITDAVIDRLDSGNIDVCFINFANADMLGHTGDLAATQAACAFIDVCIKRIDALVRPAGGALLITADHGNAEDLLSRDDQQRNTSHSSNPVPLYYIRQELQRSTARSDAEVSALFHKPIGVLADVAPTILDVLRLDMPSTMTGVSLLGSF